jgi:ABC-type methionine transport system permease subunit
MIGSRALSLTVLSVAVSVSLWLAVAPASTVAFGMNAESSAAYGQTWALVLGYLTTLVGVFLGSAYRLLRQRQAAGKTQIDDIRRFVQSVLRSIDFWLGVVSAPLVYALLWRSVADMPAAAMVFTALQNGFFCTLVADTLRPPTTAVAISADPG